MTRRTRVFEKIIARSLVIKSIIECLQTAFVAIKAQSKFNETLLKEITSQRQLITDMQAINELLIKSNPKLISIIEQHQLGKEIKKDAN